MYFFCELLAPENLFAGIDDLKVVQHTQRRHRRPDVDESNRLSQPFARHVLCQQTECVLERERLDIDDLGRQAEPPQAIVNRWIVPLEEQRDFLALNSGEKFEVPFDTLVIFSTNFHPNKIFDQAALRRIFYKVKIDGPSKKDFLKIFGLVARHKGVELDQESMVHLLRNKYPTVNNVFANYQPVFLIDQIKAICDFEELPYKTTPELIDRAWANLFVENEEIVR